MTEARPPLFSLRALGLFGTAVLTLAGMGLGALALGIRPDTLRRDFERAATKQPQIARRNIVYRLESDQPIFFRFSQPVTLARIVTTPTVGPGQADPGETWTYAFKIELLDESERVIETRQLFARAGMFERDGKQIGPYRFFRSRDDIPAVGDEVRIASKRSFAAVRLLATVADRDVLAVTVRVWERQPLLAIAADTAFARYSPDDRRRLTLPNAFPAEMLTAEERRNIAINQWKPVGPVGVVGRDYRMDILYEEVEAPVAVERLKDRADGE